MNHVIVIEDDELIAMYLKYVLEQEGGYRVSVTESGDEALTLARQPDTIAALVDVSLRATRYDGKFIDGIELTRLMKAQRASGVAVIIVTAHGMPGDRERLLEASGADGYVGKPIADSSALIALIRELGGR